MKQSKTSALLLGLTVAFAVFCMGVLIGKADGTEGFRIVTDRVVMLAVSETAQTQVPTVMQTEETTTFEPTTEADPFPININTACAEDLMRLPKIGPTLAQRIIDYREKYGLFETAKELDMIEGIGTKILEDILDLVTVEE